MKKPFGNVVSAFVLLAFGSVGFSVCAKTYYVAPPPVGDDGNSGTKDAPFATIQKALDMTDIGCCEYYLPPGLMLLVR